MTLGDELAQLGLARTQFAVPDDGLGGYAARFGAQDLLAGCASSATIATCNLGGHFTDLRRRRKPAADLTDWAAGRQR
jgi:hypothetical protein